MLIEGPRACGKTETARQQAASEVLLDVDRNAQVALQVDPALLLNGATPRLLDEWQLGPSLWNHVRRAVDDRRLRGQFILTGSAVPDDDATRHTGAGRIARLRMRPLSSFEAGRSTGMVSLAALLDGGAPSAPMSETTVPSIMDWICIGGWPGLLDLTPPQAQQVLRGYLNDVCLADLSRLDGVSRDPIRVRQLLRSLGRHTASYAAATTLAADTAGLAAPLSNDTVRDYLAALERIMIVEDQPAWGPSLRSRARLRRSAKRHLVDPSLAVAALDAGPAQLLADLNTAGFLFESMVVRDLRVYSQLLDLQTLQYRDSSGDEVDAVLVARDGRWVAVEVKLGAGQVDAAAGSLLSFAGKVATDVHRPPSALVVVTGTGYAYRRPDGIDVVPIGHLGP